MTKFCLTMEDHRRTDAGRVRTAREFVAQFFPWAEGSAKDHLFHYLPNDIRGPILSEWGIRGVKAALRDDDEKVREVVHDALVAGDIDEATFEQGVTAQVLVDWIPLPEWWTFWRQGKLTGIAIQKALATARELGLIDDRWFLDNLQGRGGKLKGTDVLCDTLSKDQIVAWVRKIHEAGDGSPAGIVAAIGWETVLAKTAQDALLFALDAFAKKVGLLAAPAQAQPTAPPRAPSTVSQSPPSSAEPETARGGDASDHPTFMSPSDAAAAAAEAEAAELASRTSSMAAQAYQPPPDSGLSVSIPDSPVIESYPPGPIAGGPTQRGLGAVEESAELAAARAQMMAMLGDGSAPAPRDAWDESEVPAKPSSLEWPEPPPVVVGPNGRPGPSGAPTATPAPPMSEDVIAIEDDALMSERTPAPAPTPSKSPPKPPPLAKGAPPAPKR